MPDSAFNVSKIIEEQWDEKKAIEVIDSYFLKGLSEKRGERHAKDSGPWPILGLILTLTFISHSVIPWAAKPAYLVVDSILIIATLFLKNMEGDILKHEVSNYEKSGTRPRPVNSKPEESHNESDEMARTMRFSVKLALWEKKSKWHFFFGKTSVAQNASRSTTMFEALLTITTLGSVCSALTAAGLLALRFLGHWYFPLSPALITRGLFMGGAPIILAIATAAFWPFYGAIQLDHARKAQHASDIYFRSIVEKHEKNVLFRFALLLLVLDLWPKRQFASTFFNALFEAICELNPQIKLHREKNLERFKQNVCENIAREDKILTTLEDAALKVEEGFRAKESLKRSADWISEELEGPSESGE
jgi:hypothetical protein